MSAADQPTEPEAAVTVTSPGAVPSADQVVDEATAKGAVPGNPTPGEYVELGFHIAAVVELEQQLKEARAGNTVPALLRELVTEVRQLREAVELAGRRAAG